MLSPALNSKVRLGLWALSWLMAVTRLVYPTVVPDCSRRPCESLWCSTVSGTTSPAS